MLRPSRNYRRNGDRLSGRCLRCGCRENPVNKNAKRKPSALSRKPMPKMLDRQKEPQQGTKTIEIVDGVPQFYLVVPCAPAEKPDRVTPLYLVEENEFGGAESGVWQCRECTRIYNSRRSWEKHKCIRWITGPEIKVCA